MNVIDYGRIFIPQEYGLDYAKSPQAMVFDDYVRIYFCYCVPDGIKLVSKIGFVDYKKNFKDIIQVSKDVIKESALGTYDEHGIFPFSPFRDGDVIKSISTGWSRRKSVSAETSLGLTISYDGGNYFERVGTGPVMTASLHEPYLIADGFVVKLAQDNYKMFYIYGVNWDNYKEAEQPERTYRIAVAESSDLLEWKRNGREIITEKFVDEAQALPTVINRHGKWHMFFCYRHTVGFRNNTKMAYRIGYAHSENLDTWVRDDDSIQIPLANWCSEMQCYPNVFIMNDEVYLLYNGNHFGKNGFGLLRLDEE